MGQGRSISRFGIRTAVLAALVLPATLSAEPVLLNGDPFEIRRAIKLNDPDPSGDTITKIQQYAVDGGTAIARVTTVGPNGTREKLLAFDTLAAQTDAEIGSKRPAQQGRVVAVVGEMIPGTSRVVQAIGAIATRRVTEVTGSTRVDVGLVVRENLQDPGAIVVVDTSRGTIVQEIHASQIVDDEGAPADIGPITSLHFYDDFDEAESHTVRNSVIITNEIDGTSPVVCLETSGIDHFLTSLGAPVENIGPIEAVFDIGIEAGSLAALAAVGNDFGHYFVDLIDPLLTPSGDLLFQSLVTSSTVFEFVNSGVTPQTPESTFEPVTAGLAFADGNYYFIGTESCTCGSPQQVVTAYDTELDHYLALIDLSTANPKANPTQQSSSAAEGLTSTSQAAPSAEFTAFLEVDASGGDLLVTALDGFGTLGLYAQQDGVLRHVVDVGDQLFGKTVTGIGLVSGDGIDHNLQALQFSATFADGSSEILLVRAAQEAVPSPSVPWSIASGMLALAALKQRRSARKN